MGLILDIISKVYIFKLLSLKLTCKNGVVVDVITSEIAAICVLCMITVLYMASATFAADQNSGLEKQIKVKVNETFTIKGKIDSSTGYILFPSYDSEFLKFLSKKDLTQKFSGIKSLNGTRPLKTHVFEFKALKTGETDILMEYKCRAQVIPVMPNENLVNLPEFYHEVYHVTITE